MTDLGLDGALGWLLIAAIPLLLVACTAFTKVAVVLSALRIGLGAEVLLPFAVILVLALLVSGLIMAPVGVETVEAVVGLGGPERLFDANLAAWSQVAEPLLRFLRTHASPDEIDFFSGASQVAPEDPRALVPAFLVTELTEAITMTVLILVPFAVIELVVAQVLVFLDLSNVQARIITLPLKLLVFLAAGGWDLVIGSVVEAYG
jgi:flagellar biosynthesis protein FliP